MAYDWASDDQILGRGVASGSLDFVSGFARSALESIPELVGIEPSTETTTFRAENPVSGFLSELAGMAVPYAGWARAARAIKPVARLGASAEAAVGGVEASPFLAGAAREAAHFLPFEAGRVLASPLVGDRPFTEMAAEGALNLALGSGVAGTIGKLGSMGARAKALKELLPEVDLEAPLQLQLRRLDELSATAPPERLPVLNTARANIETVARAEVPLARERYLAPLVGGDSAQLETYFQPGGNITKSKRFITSTSDDGFANPDEWKAAQLNAGLPDDFTRWVQFPRLVEFAQPEGGTSKATRSAKVVQGRVTKNLQPIGDGWFLGREADDGMFVMAKKIAGGEKAAPEDKWLLFKTDSPAKFAKEQQQWHNTQLALEKWRVGASGVERRIQESGTFVAEAHGLMRAAPMETYLERIKVSTPEGRVGKAAARLPEGVRESEALGHVNQLVREFLAPTGRQLKSGKGSWTLNMGRMFQQAADTLAQRIIQGEARIENSVWRSIWSGKPGSIEGRSLQAVYDEFRANPKLFDDFIYLWRNEVTPDAAESMVANGLIHPRSAELAREVESINAGLMRQVNGAEDAAGRRLTRSRGGHYGISRFWDGDVFTAIRDEGGKPVGFAAGFNQAQSQKRAKELLGEINRRTGRSHSIGETFNRAAPSGVPRDLVPFVTNPGFTMERGNLRGFKWDVEKPGIDEFFQAHSDNVYKRTTYMANLTRESLLQRHLASLATEDPFAYKVVTTRFNQMSGVPGEFSKAQNRVVDRVLAPVLGRNSATKIVQATNSAMWHLQLGMGKLSYPITNLLGNIQVVAPELSFVLTSSDSALVGPYHDLVPAVGTRGPVGVMGFLSPLKIMGQAMKEMHRPGGDLRWAFNRAANERVFDPRMLEEFVGQQATTISRFRDALKSPGQFFRAVGELSNWVPSASERFARVHAYTAGWVAFRDIIGITDPEQLHRLARKFTERTMYGYSSADRPLAFTSPLGSSMGLFKNWMFNYMASMAEYAGQGLSRGNWAPLAWQTVGAGLTGGLAATPLIWAADGFSRVFGDKRIEQWTFDELNGRTATGVMYGLPAALTGVSFSSAMTVPGANPVRDASQLFSFAAWDRIKQLGGGVAAAMDNWKAGGGHPGSDPDVRNQLIRAFAPVNIYRAMSVDWDEGQIRTLATGLPQIKGLGTGDLILYSLGLQPVQLEKHLTAANALYESREKHKGYVKALGDRYLEAMQAGDSAAMQEVFQRSITVGVDISSVLRSASTRAKAEREPVTERLSKPQDLAKWRSLLEE